MSSSKSQGSTKGTRNVMTESASAYQKDAVYRIAVGKRSPQKSSKWGRRYSLRTLLNRWGDQLLLNIARKSDKEVCEELKLLPLRFKNVKIEERFRDHISSSLRPRLIVMASIELVIIIIVWLIGGLETVTLSEEPIDPNGNRQRMFFHTTLSTNFCIFLCILIMAIFKRPRRLQESLTICLLLLVATGAVTTLSAVLAVKSDALGSVNTAKRLTIDNAIIWVFISLITLMSPPIIILGGLVRFRLSQLWLINMGYSLSALIGSIAIACRYNQMISVLIGLECFLLGWGSSLARYHEELQERVQFWSFTKTQVRMKVLHNEVLRLTPAKEDKVTGESTLEELMTLLKHAQKLISNTSPHFVTSELIQTDEIIKEVLRILPNGSNLFKVRFINLPEEGESIIDHYILGKPTEEKSSDIPKLGQHGAESTQDPTSGTDDHTNNSVRNAGGRLNKTKHDLTLKKKFRNCPTLQVELAAIAQGGSKRGFNDLSPDHADKRIDFDLFAVSGAIEAVGHTWDIPIFELEKQHFNIIVHFGGRLLMPFLTHLDIGQETLLKFLACMEDCYWDNPYHNKIHAATVSHSIMCLVSMMNLQSAATYDALTEVTHIVAALGHDVGHPGRNNQFFINCFDPLAIIYNDKSVLENYHAFLTFQILDDEKCDIFQHVIIESYRQARKRIIELILATDMKEHFECISRFRVRRCASDFNMKRDVEDMWLTIRFLFKAADLSHSCVGWDSHSEWSFRVQEEFYQQGDEEAILGYPKSPLCDRSTHASFAKSQKGFLEFVVSPLITEICEVDTSGMLRTELLNKLLANKEKWEELEQSNSILEIPSHIGAMETTPRKSPLPAMVPHTLGNAFLPEVVPTSKEHNSPTRRRLENDIRAKSASIDSLDLPKPS